MATTAEEQAGIDEMTTAQIAQNAITVTTIRTALSGRTVSAEVQESILSTLTTRLGAATTAAAAAAVDVLD